MSQPAPLRQTMDVDIVCVGFGPATAGFLTTLSGHLMNPDGTPAIESPSCPGLPLQVICYERADDIGFGVSGVVTRARGIRASLPDLDISRIPMAAPVQQEEWSTCSIRWAPAAARPRSALPMAPCAASASHRDYGVELPYVPPFLHKTGGLILSLGQFMQFVGGELMAPARSRSGPACPSPKPSSIPPAKASSACA